MKPCRLLTFQKIKLINYTDGQSYIHAEYGEFEAVYSGGLIEGELPRKQQKLTEEWLTLHKDELKADWKLLQSGEQSFKIQPLQ